MSRIVFGPFCLLIVVACGDGKLDAFVPVPSDAAEAAATAPAPSEAVPAVSVQQPLLVDDLEDGDFLVQSPLNGYWYAFNDESSRQDFDVTIPNRVRDGSAYAVRTAGRRFRDWGAGVGVYFLGELVDGKARAIPFDVSAYAAVSFWARASRRSEQQVYVHLLNPDPTGGDDFQHFTTAIDLSTRWTRYVLPFDGFILERNQVLLPDEPFDPTQLTHLQFFWFSPDTFEAWIDDLAFLPAP